MFLGYILYIRTLEHPFKWFHHFSPNTSLFAWGKTDIRCSHCHYPPVIGENTGPPVWLFPVGSAKREVGLLGPWLVLTCHRIVLNVVSYNWWNWSMIILCHSRGMHYHICWTRRLLMVEAEFRSPKAVQPPHTCPSWQQPERYCSRNILSEHHPEFHPASSSEPWQHGGFQREKCIGFQRLLPSRPSHIHLLQTETAAKFSGPLTPDSLRVAVGCGANSAGPEKTNHNPYWKDATWEKHKYHTSWYHIWQLSATTTWSRSDKSLSVRHWFIWLFQGSDQVWTSTSRRVQNKNPSLKSRLFTSSSYVLLHWKLRFETSRSSSGIWASSRSLRDTRKPCPIRKMRGENLDQHGLPNMLLLTWASQHVAGPPQSQCQAPLVVPEMLKGEFPWMTRWIVWLIPISMLIPQLSPAINLAKPW